MAQLKRPIVKNPELERALLDFKEMKNAQTEQAMLKAVEKANFVAPVTLLKPLDEVQTDDNGEKHLQVQFAAVADSNGDKFFPAFTSWLEFLKWKNDPDADTMQMTFDQYCDLVLKRGGDMKGIVINPSESGVAVRKEYMAKVKGVTLPDETHAVNTAIAPLFGAQKIQNPDLLAAVRAFRADSSGEHLQAVFQALRTGRFVAPAIMHDLPKRVRPGQRVNAKAEFLMINLEGGRHLPVFSSLAELQRWTGAPANCSAVPLQLGQYAEMLSNPNNTAAGIVIDPFTIGLTFPKEQVLRIMPSVQIRDLKVFPFDLAQSLKERLADFPEVRSAYLAGVKANGVDGHLIILDMENNDAMQQIANVLSEIAKPFGPAVVAPLRSPLGRDGSKGKSPFYEAE